MLVKEFEDPRFIRVERVAMKVNVKSTIVQTINFFARRKDFLGQKSLGHKKSRKDTKRMFLIFVVFSCLFAIFVAPF